MQKYKLFEIDDYDLKENEISVLIVRKEEFEEVKIPRDSYEQWLKDSGRLDWCDDHSNHNGDHVQFTGIYPIDYYWTEIFIDKKSDLYDWIILKNVAEGVFDIKQPLHTILGEHYSNTLKAAI